MALLLDILLGWFLGSVAGGFVFDVTGLPVGLGCLLGTVAGIWAMRARRARA